MSEITPTPMIPVIYGHPFEKISVREDCSGQQVSLTPGKYRLEVWGAEGGSSASLSGGRGGYSVGDLWLQENTTFFVFVGGSGKALSAGSAVQIAGGCNGGGWGLTGIEAAVGSGGGATDIRVGDTALASRIIVAGGGGGSGGTGSGGSGGAEVGGVGSGTHGGLGANQSGPGLGCGGGGNCGSGSLGLGGNFSGDAPSAGGGGGFYGGGSGFGGGGGSSFVFTEFNPAWELSGKFLLSDAHTQGAVWVGNGMARITILVPGKKCTLEGNPTHPLFSLVFGLISSSDLLAFFKRSTQRVEIGLQ